MAKKLNITLVMILLVISSNLKGGELTFGWNLTNESGPINDMEFMPDNNFFIIGTSADVQIRKTETGELVNSYPFPASQIEFSPDSTKIILSYKNRIEVRNLSDMSLIKEHIIPEGTDTAGYDIFQSGIRFTEIVVDPVRPYVYAIRTREGYLSITGKYFVIRRIIIINYETMEEVDILSLNEEDYTLFEKIAISKDGKYLAVNNQGLSKLWVWSLDTRQKLREFALYPLGATEDDNWGVPSCTKFSELNTDLIFFSGRFPQSKDGTNNYDGIFIFSLEKNRIIDSTFGTGPLSAGGIYFALFDNEARAICLTDNNINIMNLLLRKIEKSILQDTITSGVRRWSKKIIYSDINKMFIGFSQESFSSANNDLETEVYDLINFDSIIYPNPTNGIITLVGLCQNPIQSYEILNMNGMILIPITIINTQQGTTLIDISSLNSGIYFLRYYCGSSITTYKVIKEG